MPGAGLPRKEPGAGLPRKEPGGRLPAWASTASASTPTSTGSPSAAVSPPRSAPSTASRAGISSALDTTWPQDVPALVEIVGRERFLERLKWGFEKSRPFRYNAPGENYAKFPVVQGNQQSMHFAFLFNWAKEPWETQKWARSIIERFYGYGDSTAWLGDEDQGQMSAWLVMASLGLFQTDGGCRAEPIYEIASPLYEKAEVDLGSSRTARRAATSTCSAPC